MGLARKRIAKDEVGCFEIGDVLQHTNFIVFSFVFQTNWFIEEVMVAIYIFCWPFRFLLSVSC
jgi:hypothetical protein